MQATSFENRVIELRGNLQPPPDFDAAGSYAALVLATPGSSVKEQIGAVCGAATLAMNIGLRYRSAIEGELVRALVESQPRAARPSPSR